jgi:predicted transcriptional regulator
MAKKKQEVEKKLVDNGRPFEVSITSTGVILESGLSLDRAKQKVKDLETRDLNLKGKNWTVNFYTITEQ